MKEVQQKIGSSEPYICGGTPRDRFMKRLDNISDLDLTTGDKSIQYLAQEFGQELSKKYNVTTRFHDDGHGSIYIGSFKMDFSSNFNVPNIDKILLTKGIKNPTEMQKEMFSRDFTCNALLLSIDLKNVVDPTHRGFRDIQDKMIRTCLDPQITLTTNKNRVIRAVYLAAKLDFDIDPSIVDYVSQHPESVKISSEKALAEKLNEAFNRNPDRAAHYITKMNLWPHIPITEVVKPYYLKHGITAKRAYFQGGGGVNEPTPGKKKYKSDKAIVVQPRFEEPLYRNYDLYDVPGKHGPGSGWHSMQNYKSVSEFLKARRKKLKDKYKADDSWIEDDGSITKDKKVKARSSLLSKLIKISNDCSDSDIVYSDKRDAYYCSKCNHMGFNGPSEPKPTTVELHSGKDYTLDSNNIDFPMDQYIDPGIAVGDQENFMSSVNPMGGYLDKYLPLDDFEGKPPTALNFGRDYVKDEHPTKNHIKLDDIEKLLNQYLSHGLYGLPDGVDLPEEDIMESPNSNPYYGTLGPDSLIYEDKWNI